MAITLTVNGTGYSFPQTADENWGENVTNWASAVTSGMLQRAGGTFTLVGEVDFGATFGLKTAYYKSRATNPAGAGVVRLGNAETIAFRNAANNGDLTLTANASNELIYNATKLLLSGAVVDVDIASGAAIAFSKMAALTASRVLISDGSGVVSASTVTGTTLAFLDATSSIQTQLDAKASVASLTAHTSDLANPHSVTKAQIGLANADNTSDMDKPVSTAQAAAIQVVQDDANAHEARVDNPHLVTKAQVGLTNVTDDAQLKIASNLSDLANAATARTNLGLGNVDNTSDATKNAAAATLTNKTLTAPAINGANIDGGTASNTSRITVPKDTYANLLLLTRKAGTLVYATDSSKVYYDDGTNLTEVGSGSGSGGVNYITNGDGELNTTGWALYNDGIVTTPVDGTGGSTSNLTFTSSAANILRGDKSFLLDVAAPGVNAGVGISYDFTIDDADKYRVLKISFDYKQDALVGTSPLLGVWIYDVTNARLIEPVGKSVQQSVITTQHQATFQTTNSSSYRLIVHFMEGPSLAKFYFDSITVGPQSIARGPMISDWVSYTPTFTGFGTVTVQEFQWRRVGSDVEIRGKFTAGTTTAVESRLSLPSGLTSAAASVIPSIQYAGQVLRNITGAAQENVALIEPSVGYVTFGIANASQAPLTKQNGSAWVLSGEVVTVNAVVPILGWSSNQVLSSDEDGRVCIARYTNVAGTSISTTPTAVTFATKSIDSHSAYSGSTFTVPLPGKYTINAKALASGNAGSSQIYYGAVYKNGALYSREGTPGLSGVPPVWKYTDEIDCVAGDTLQVYLWGSAGPFTLSTTVGDCFMSISRKSGPSQIAASENISASYYLTASFAASATIPINFNGLEFDSHGAVTTSATAWKFTAPISGEYHVTGIQNTGTISTLNLFKNGVQYKGYGYNNGSQPSQASTKIRLLAGDYIDFRPSVAATFTGGTQATSLGAIQISRVGN